MGTPSSAAADPSVRRLLAILSLAGLLLFAAVIPGTFTMDEDNYLVSALALRQGRVTVPGTEGLPPTRALLYFDPMDRSRIVESTPVAPVVPPLYAFLGAPFSYLGHRGLVLINTLAFLATVLVVFVWTRKLTGEGPAPWLAAAAFGLGSYQLEYAQGIWPHALAVFLCTTGAYFAFRVRDDERLRLALPAGLLLGFAVGVRYQNLLLTGLVGLGLLLFARRRIAASACYGLGVLAPLFVSSLINHARVDSWNPVSKGGHYLSLGAGHATKAPLTESIHVLWSKVIDFSAHPAFTGAFARVHSYLQKDETSGAILVFPDALKKAWLQSSPWLLVALASLIAAWRFGALSREKRELRALSLLVFPVVGFFAAAGFYRMDGLCFNQRYFLELTPLVAIALGIGLSKLPLPRTPLLVGALVSLAIVAFASTLPASDPMRHLLYLKVPVVLGVGALAVFLMREKLGAAPTAALVVGAGIAWALGAHVTDDLRASRIIRDMHAVQVLALEEELPARSALLAWSGRKIPLGPLQLEHDVVIADPSAAGPGEANALVDALIAQGRTVLLIENGMPKGAIAELSAGRATSSRSLPLLGGYDALRLLELQTIPARENGTLPVVERP